MCPWDTDASAKCLDCDVALFKITWFTEAREGEDANCSVCVMLILSIYVMTDHYKQQKFLRYRNGSCLLQFLSLLSISKFIRCQDAKNAPVQQGR